MVSTRWMFKAIYRAKNVRLPQRVLRVLHHTHDASMARLYRFIYMKMVLVGRCTSAMDASWDISIKNWMGPNPNGPLSCCSYWNGGPTVGDVGISSLWIFICSSCWWLIQPISKIMLVNLDHETPSFGMNIKRYLSCHHLVIDSWLGRLLISLVASENSNFHQLSSLFRSTRQTMPIASMYGVFTYIPTFGWFVW